MFMIIGVTKNQSESLRGGALSYKEAVADTEAAAATAACLFCLLAIF